MVNGTDKIFLGKASQPEADRLQKTLAKHGISLGLAHNAATCTSGGCGIQLEIWAHPDDVAQIQQIIALEWQESATYLQHDPTLAAHVFDPTAEQVTCPACATVFVPSNNECPDCGLTF
jgi:hypothetical protein